MANQKPSPVSVVTVQGKVAEQAAWLPLRGRKRSFPVNNKQISINLDVETVEYFKAQAEETGIPYQKLINFYLADCVRQKKKLAWL